MPCMVLQTYSHGLPCLSVLVHAKPVNTGNPVIAGHPGLGYWTWSWL